MILTAKDVISDVLQRIGGGSSGMLNVLNLGGMMTDMANMVNGITPLEVIGANIKKGTVIFGDTNPEGGVVEFTCPEDVMRILNMHTGYPSAPTIYTQKSSLLDVQESAKINKDSIKKFEFVKLGDTVVFTPKVMGSTSPYFYYRYVAYHADITGDATIITVSKMMRETYKCFVAAVAASWIGETAKMTECYNWGMNQIQFIYAALGRLPPRLGLTDLEVAINQLRAKPTPGA